MNKLKNFIFHRKDASAKKISGFSLIELLVVVGIIGVLAAVAIPAYNIYSLSAAETAVEAEASGLMQALQACLISTDGDTLRCATEDVDMTVSNVCQPAGHNVAPTVSGCTFHRDPTNICYGSTRKVGAAFRHHCFYINTDTQIVKGLAGQGTIGMPPTWGFCSSQGGGCRYYNWLRWLQQNP